jgi:sarcosine oxidase subunit beta
VLNIAPDVRYPVLGGTLQRRGGTARHDAVAWAFARTANRQGVDLLQGTLVTGFVRSAGRVTGIETSRGQIHAGVVALAAAGHTTVLAERAGIRLPVQSRPLQALVSELYEPLLNGVVLSNAVHAYVSQAEKGELVMGAGTDQANSYTQRGSFRVIERQMAAVLELFPRFARAHVLRTWAGIVDVTPDASPLIGPTPVSGLLVNCGWGTGGFKATPASGFVYAHQIATGSAHRLAIPFTPTRFAAGALIDEHGAAAVAH